MNDTDNHVAVLSGGGRRLECAASWDRSVGPYVTISGVHGTGVAHVHADHIDTLILSLAEARDALTEEA